MNEARFIYGSSSGTPDILYASGFMCIDPFIYFSCGEIRAVIVPTLEYGRAQKEVKKGVGVLDRKSFLLGDAKTETLKDVLTGLLRKYSPDTWLVPGNTSYAIVRHMQEQGASVRVVESDFFPERRIKDAEEIKKITAAQRSAEKAMRKAYEMLEEASVDKAGRLVLKKEPLTSEFIRRQINVSVVEDGGVAMETIVSNSAHSADPHSRGHGNLMAGSPIVVDIFPRMEDSGYWGDITRTFVKGKAPSIVKKAYAAVREARDRAKEDIRAGAIASEISRKATEILEKHGFKTGRDDKGNFGFIHSLGHGLGLEIHENPRISPKNDNPLEKGNVITVEPGLYYPEWGGIRLEDVVVVEDESCTTLTKFPTKLEI